VRRLATLLVVAAIATALGAVPAAANLAADGGKTMPAGVARPDGSSCAEPVSWPTVLRD
jgi:hypothetical protein